MWTCFPRFHALGKSKGLELTAGFEHCGSWHAVIAPNESNPRTLLLLPKVYRTPDDRRPSSPFFVRFSWWAPCAGAQFWGKICLLFAQNCHKAVPSRGPLCNGRWWFFFLMGFGTGVSPSVSAGPKESIMGAPQSLSAAPLSGHTPWTKFLPLLLLAWLLLFTWMPIWKATV